jgi:sulfide:quinone oxidoreductase
VQARVVVLGGGFAGLELATILSAELGEGVEVTLLDRNDAFVFGFAKLDLMFGHAAPEAVRFPYGDIAKPGVRFRQETVLELDPVARRVTTDAGVHDADFVVIALGAEYDLDATPGLAEAGHEFYSVAGAEKLRALLPSFSRGRALIGVCGAPYKCPPAPSEAALLLHDMLTERGVRGDCEITYVVPSPTPVTSSAEASTALLAAFAERGIEFVPGRRVASLDPGRGVAVLDDGSELPHDLFLGVPRHRPPALAAVAGLAEDGWVQVGPTMETGHPGVYAVGDVASMKVPKAGTFAEGQARVVAASILAAVRGGPPAEPYVGRGSCYIEFGHGRVSRVDVEFGDGGSTGTFNEPSALLAEDKRSFGTSRRARWFGT